MTPGYYQLASDDLPAGEGVLLPGPGEEVQCFQRVYLAIRQSLSAAEPLLVHLHQHVGEEWTPARTMAMMADATLSHIGIPGWELLSPAQHAYTLEWLRESVAELGGE